jgi:hypothetical protein
MFFSQDFDKLWWAWLLLAVMVAWDLLPWYCRAGILAFAVVVFAQGAFSAAVVLNLLGVL